MICQILWEDLGKVCCPVWQISNKSTVTTCEDFIQKCQTNPCFLNYIVTGDKAWMFQHNPECHSMVWGTSSPFAKDEDQKDVDRFYKTRCDPHKIYAWRKNSESYVQVLERLLKQFLQMRPVLKGSWFLFTMPFPLCHSSYMLLAELQRDGDQLPTLLSWPHDSQRFFFFFLFPRLKSALRRRRFQDIKEM